MDHSRITILGGTGTLGKALTASIINAWPGAEITIVSRDEHKQAHMRREFPRCRYVIGDIRDPSSVSHTFQGRNIIFHVAALKHVDILESCPMESIKTNTLSTDHLAKLAVSAKVRQFVFSSTDKAVDPINTYGYSKALSEKILWNYNQQQKTTQFSVYRWGNVLGSQGSVIPVFIDSLLKTKSVNVTDVNMSRYWIPIEWAVRYMLRTFPEAYLDKAMVPPTMKAAKLIDVVDCLAYLLDIEKVTYNKIPIRPGEKIHEAMYSQHSDHFETSETAPQYTFPELVEMLRPFVQAKMAKAAA